MTVATTNPPLQALCNYRPAPVVTPLGRWHQYAPFYPHREQENECHWHETDTTMNIGISVMSYFAGSYRQFTTQIPIARLTSMTAWLRPAVSSIEACKTPAR